MTSRPTVIEEPCLSHAWATALEVVTQPGVTSVSPLVVSFTEFTPSGDPIEDPALRGLLDGALQVRRLQSSRTVANTIFPRSLWNPASDRHSLYDRYMKVYPRIRKEPANRHGMYFHRMISYGDARTGVNQLEFILDAFLRGVTRRSALQLAIIDPHLDHVRTRQRGFPCLHQVAFTPAADGSLVLTAFYATQHIFHKAYGNYLGLAELGAFFARETGRHLTRVTCVAANATRGEKITVAAARTFLNAVPHPVQAPAVTHQTRETDAART